MESLNEILNKLVGQKVTYIDSTNALIRISGKLKLNNGMVVIVNGFTNVLLHRDSIIDYKVIKTPETTNVQLKLHNSNRVEIVF